MLEAMMEAAGESFCMHKTKNKQCSPVAQNEILEILYCCMIRNLAKKMNDQRHFGSMVDKGADVSKTELLSAVSY